MDSLVDRLLRSYDEELDGAFLEVSRPKIQRYIETLASAGKSDPRQLAKFGRAYLKELRSPDPRYTGC